MKCHSCCLELDNWAERDVPYLEHLSCTTVKCNFIDMSGVAYVTENISLGHTIAQKRTSEPFTSTVERRKSPSPPSLEHIIENEIFIPSQQHQPNEIFGTLNFRFICSVT